MEICFFYLRKGDGKNFVLQRRCTLPTIQLMSFEVSPVLVLRVIPTQEDCTVELLSCKVRLIFWFLSSYYLSLYRRMFLVFCLLCSWRDQSYWRAKVKGFQVTFVLVSKAIERTTANLRFLNVFPFLVFQRLWQIVWLGTWKIPSHFWRLMWAWKSLLRWCICISVFFCLFKILFSCIPLLSVAFESVICYYGTSAIHHCAVL